MKLGPLHHRPHQSGIFKTRIFACCAALLLLLGLSATRARAQASAGITGTVTDSSGAVVADAQVAITNVGTSIVTTATTTSSGTYTVKGLAPGVYKVVTTAAGFKQSVQDGVTVEVSTTATIDVTLTAGSAGEVVEVTENAIALNTTQPQMGSTIEAYVVQSLPVEVSGGRGRQIDALQFLAPGTTGSTFSHRVGGGVDFEEEIVYNGVPFPQPETEGYTTNLTPPFDMVQELRVERSTFAAQFGLGQGALTYQMASGTNKYHGNLFEINRNSFFDSVGFFNNSYWNPSNVHNKPTVDHENNYGFTVGGPVWIPKLYNGRDRTFFHYSQEWYKQNSENTNPATVPTVLQKSGDFTDFVDVNGKIIPIYDPLTGKQFEFNGRLNVIDPARISANSATLLQYIPDPNRPGIGAGGLTQNRSFAPFVTPTINHVWGFTVDHTLNKTQSVHYSQWRNSQSSEGFDYTPMVLPPNPLNGLRFYPNLGSGFILNYSNAISPTLVATAGIGWFGEINNQFNHSKYSFPAVQDGVIPPNILFDGASAPSDWGTGGSNTGSVNRKLGIALVNNYLWNRGRNTFNFGVEFRRSYQDDNEEQFAGGHFNFSQRTTSVPNTSDPNFGNYGSSFASFLLGIPDSAGRINSQELRLRNWDLSPYIQDDIKITPKLTVNLGLRWDLMAPFTENHNLIVFFDPTRTNPAAGGLPGAANKFGNCTGCAGFSSADMHFGHVGPRFGLAYQLNSKTVFQGGFSIAFLNGGAYEYGTNKVAVNYGNLLVGSYARNSTNSYTSAFGSWDTNILPNPPATPFSAGLGVGTGINQFSSKDGFAPYSEQWNINMQRELPYNILMTAAWVGNRVIHLPSNLNNTDQLDPKYLTLGQSGVDINNLNFADGSAQAAGFSLPYPNFVNDFGGSATVAQSLRPYPQYSSIQNNFEGSGTTYYQSAQIQAEKRFSDGLSFLLGYTLSRLYDNTSSGFTSFANGALNKFNQKPEYVVSGSDEPNNFKLSGTYELPIGPGKKYFNNKKLTGQIAGGWQVGWILDYESGTAFGVGQNGSPLGTGNRPDRATGVGLSTASYNKERDFYIHQGGKGLGPAIFNPAAFTPAGAYHLGNSLRNYAALRSPGTANENLNVRKHFYFGERFEGILQLDYFNAFNRTIFQAPDTNISDSAFGTPNNATANNSPRQGQIQFKLQF